MNGEEHLDRWSGAGLIDGETAARIRAFEAFQPDTRRVRWPVILAVAFGGVLLAAGLLLFVSAHWDALSPTARIAIVIAALAALHAGGALSSKTPALATTLHAVGTVGLGGAIAVSGQVFNMNEHWPAAIFVWALGAWLGVWLLRDVAQTVIAAILTPAWIASEISESFKHLHPDLLVWIAAFVALTALAYLSAARPAETTLWRKALAAIGTTVVLPAALLITLANDPVDLKGAWLLLLPVLLAFVLRKQDGWPVLGWAAWVFFQVLAEANRTDLASYLLAGAASVALTWWGIVELRKERVNVGIAGFVITVLAFYSIHFIDAVNRSLGLIGLGLLFLLGGWQLERLRRKLMRRIEQGAPA